MNQEVLRKLYGLRRNFRKEEDVEDCITQELSDRKYKAWSLIENLETAVGIETAAAKASVFSYVIKYLDDIIRDFEQGETTFVCTRALRGGMGEVLVHVGSVWQLTSTDDDDDSIFTKRVLVNDENEILELNKYAVTDHFEVKLS